MLSKIHFYITDFSIVNLYLIALSPFCLYTQKTNFKKILELENELTLSASKVQPLPTKPKVGSRGAALYAENNQWYRYV